VKAFEPTMQFAGMLTVSNYDEFLTLVKTIKRKKEESGFTPGKAPKVVAIFGPSGSGKTYLSNELLRNEGFERVITTTTRHIRPDEATSAYNFVSREVFQKMQEDGAFVETAVYHGEKYGTCIHDIKTIMAKGKSPVIVLDINGVLAMKTLYGKSCLAIFVDREKKECIRSILSRYPGGSVNVDEATERIASIDAEMNNSGLADIVCTSDDADEIRMYMRGESNE
jgi:guanylate kinase